MSDEADAFRYAMLGALPEPPAPAIALYVPYVGWFQPDGPTWTKIPRPRDWRRVSPSHRPENHDHKGYRDRT